MLKNYEQKQKKKEKVNQSQKNILTKPKKTMATLRLEKDLLSYRDENIDFVQLQFPNEESLQLIAVIISPQNGSPYQGCEVTFQLAFPDSYPMDPPKLKCLDRIYHPNINYQGSVCLPLVRQDYTPTVNLAMIICGLIFILTYPNGEDALNPSIGDLMAKDPSMFIKIVEYTVEGRSFQNKQYDKVKNKKQNKQKEGTFSQIIGWFQSKKE